MDLGNGFVADCLADELVERQVFQGENIVGITVEKRLQVRIGRDVGGGVVFEGDGVVFVGENIVRIGFEKRRFRVRVGSSRVVPRMIRPTKSLAPKIREPMLPFGACMRGVLAIHWAE